MAAVPSQDRWVGRPFPAILTVWRHYGDRRQSRSLRELAGRVAAATGQIVAVPWRPGGLVPLLGVTELAGPRGRRRAAAGSRPRWAAAPAARPARRCSGSAPAAARATGLAHGQTRTSPMPAGSSRPITRISRVRDQLPGSPPTDSAWKSTGTAYGSSVRRVVANARRRDVSTSTLVGRMATHVVHPGAARRVCPTLHGQRYQLPRSAYSCDLIW
jgi:hypothetical protein